MRYGPELVGLLARAMSDKLKGLSISKIEGGKDWVILQTRGPGVFISWNQETFGVSLISQSMRLFAEGLGTAKSGMALALSRHLTGAKIDKISQLGSDRILTVELTKYIGAGASKSYLLLTELMGRLSNLILLAEDHAVVECAKHVHPEVNRYRSVLPGQAYVPPPPLEGTKIQSLKSDNLREFLEKPLGIGKPLSSELTWALSNGILTETEVLDGLKSLRDGSASALIQSIDGYITAWPGLLPDGKEETWEVTEILKDLSFQAMTDRKREELLKKGLKSIQREQKSLQRHIDGLERQLSMTEEAKTMKLKGQAILGSLGLIPKRAKRARLSYWDESGEEIVLDVELNPALDPSKNAEVYFKKYKKFSSDPKLILEKLGKLRMKMEELSMNSDILKNVRDLKVLQDLVKDWGNGSGKGHGKQVPAPAHLKYVIGESIVLVGLNERGNRYVTFKQASQDDIWFHVREMPGSHVLLKSPSPNWEDSWVKEFCASLALFYSKGSSMERGSVDYTEKKHVRAIKGEGPAQVTYKKSRSVFVTPGKWRELLSGSNGGPRAEDS